MTFSRTPAVIFIVMILLLWEGAVKLLHVPEYLLPGPGAIASTLWRDLPSLIPHVQTTLLESLGGFLLGSLGGGALAVLFVYAPIVEAGVYPYAIALKSVPVVAIAPLLIVWFGNGLGPKIIVAAIISFFPVVVNTTRGMRAVSEEAIDLFSSLSASHTQVLLKLRMPAAVPYVFAALRISATLAVVGAVVGEFAGADRGLGFLIVVASHRLETVDMFVGILLVSALSLGLFYLMAALERLIAPWARDANVE